MKRSDAHVITIRDT